MTTLYTYQCLFCGEDFQSRRPYNTQHSPTYCSKECQDNARREIHETTCAICGKTFTPLRIGSKLCSNECKYESHRRGVHLECPVCGKTFKRNGKHRVFCSHDCFAKSMLGVSPRKGKTFTNAVRKAIRIRDNFTCVLCGSTGKEVDHILCIALGGDNSMENGRVLCRKCHIEKTKQDRKLIKAKRLMKD